jgi:RNA polymerase sigma-70 factor (ECF subfamily)
MSKEFEQLLLTRSKHLKGYSMTLCRDPVLAEDLIQQTLMKAWKYKDNYEIGTNFEGWISFIMLNEFRTHLRKKSTKNENISLSVSSESDGEVLVQYDLPVQPRQDDFVLLQDCFNRTFQMENPKFGEVIRALVFDQQSYEEYAKNIKVPIGTVKSLLHRALKEFRYLFDGKTGIKPRGL